MNLSSNEMNKFRPNRGYLLASEDLTKRPLHLRKDFEPLVTHLEIAFATEIEARGMDIRAELLNYKRILPLIKILGLFSKTFRYPMNGFIFETKDKQIVASANTSSLTNRWEIAMVATHPDYRRMGLARELVTDIINFVKDKKGKVCTLEVIAENTPAYNLYIDLGFTHYDSIAEMKLSPDNWPENETIAFPDGYSKFPLKRDKKTNDDRYKLVRKATPKKVQDFLPIDKNRFKKSRLKNLIRPLLIRLFSLKVNSWVISFQDELVGTIFVEIEQSGKNPHKIELVIDPDHQADISLAMIRTALSKIKTSGLTDQNIMISIRSTNSDLMMTLRNLGFTVVENNHKLGLKFESKDYSYLYY